MPETSQQNVLGLPLETCGIEPMTGFTRQGSCVSLPEDHGAHCICAVMTEEFLEFSRNRGNDLVTPQPENGFSGLKPGDRWCLSVFRWREACEYGVAPPVILAATSSSVLDYVSRRDLLIHAREDGHG